MEGQYTRFKINGGHTRMIKGLIIAMLGTLAVRFFVPTNCTQDILLEPVSDIKEIGDFMLCHLSRFERAPDINAITV